MANAAIALQSYRKFLESIPLDKYREELKNVKWVEQDLYPELLPQKSIFKLYWQERKFLDFESWFERFWQELHGTYNNLIALQKFKAYYFDKHDDGWFKLGFKARMYRTWTAVLTQLDFCYMFEYVCEKRQLPIKLECDAELDIRGIDARVGNINFGIGKLSQRKEARGLQRNILIIPYPVYNIDELDRKIMSPRVREASKIKYRTMSNAFNKYFGVLKNGFVVFGEEIVNKVIENIAKPERLSKVLENIRDELSGVSIH